MDDLVVLHETISVPRQAVSIRGDLEPILVSAICDVLLQMNQTQRGREVLAAFEKTTKFEAFSKQQGDPFAAIRRYVALVEGAGVARGSNALTARVDG